MSAAPVSQLLAVMLASLRLGPTLGFAPPFTLIRIPASARVVLTVALAASVPSLGGRPLDLAIAPGLLTTAAAELYLGVVMALALQLGFGLIGWAGRALDIQAGFGLAFLIDPTTRAQTPLIGAIFGYAAAAVFFTTSGPEDVIAAFAASFERIPLGAAGAPHSLAPLLEYLATLTVLSLGLAGIAIVALFLIDLVIAMMSRTLPQMNVLVLGLQVKSLVTLILLPITLGLASAGILRVLRLATENMIKLL